MKKKNLLYNVFICVFVVLIVAMLLAFIIYLLLNAELNNTTPNIYNENNSQVSFENSDAKIKLIDDYSTDYFTADKNLLIMFGSWCAHCQEELEDVEAIVDYYKNSQDINVVLIAHEYESTISNLTNMLVKDVNFGDEEVLVDLGRVIRQTLDPDASTVPISYVVDKTGTVLKKHESAITLDIAKDLLK